MAKHSVLTRASGVRVPAGPRSGIGRDPGSANGRPLRSERSSPGSSPGPGTDPPFATRPQNQIGDRLTAGRQALTLHTEVRLLVPEPPHALPDNRIVDDARGRAPSRPQSRTRSRSGDGVRLKPGRCWFDSRRVHQLIGAYPVFTPSSDLGPIEDGYQAATLRPDLRVELG
jgi:hypothetical protein